MNRSINLMHTALYMHCLFHSLIRYIPHPITGFKDDSAYVTTKTADRNQRITEDG